MKMQEVRGRVEAVLIATDPTSLKSTSVAKIEALHGYGMRHDKHAGPRLVDSRELVLRKFGIPRGTPIENHRQFSATSIEELDQIAAAMELGNLPIPPGSLGENVVVSGIPLFTKLPSGTLLFFKKGEEIRTAVLAVWGENMPCPNPGEVIQEAFVEVAGVGRQFPKAALGRRGIVGSVYCSGMIHRGDEIIVYVPAQAAQT